MLVRTFLCFSLVVICGVCVQAPCALGSPSTELTKDATKKASPFKLDGGSFVHFLVHPGMTLGVDVPFLERKRHELYVPTSAVFYIHPKNSRVLMLNSGLGYRWHSKKVVFVTTSLRVGYMHSFVAGDLYREENGEIVEVRDHGRPAFAPYFDLGVGVNLFKDRSHQFSPYFKIMAFGRYPYNGYMLPQAGWQLGVIYRFNPGKAKS